MERKRERERDSTDERKRNKGKECWKKEIIY